MSSKPEKNGYVKLNPKQLDALGLSPRSERYYPRDGNITDNISKRQYQKQRGVGQYNKTIAHKKQQKFVGNVPASVGYSNLAQSRLIYSELRARGYDEATIGKIQRLRAKATKELIIASGERKRGNNTSEAWKKFNSTMDDLRSLYPDMPNDFIKY